jgi:hypothetical protein
VIFPIVGPIIQRGVAALIYYGVLSPYKRVDALDIVAVKFSLVFSQFSCRSLHNLRSVTAGWTQICFCTYLALKLSSFAYLAHHACRFCHGHGPITVTRCPIGYRFRCWRRRALVRVHKHIYRSFGCHYCGGVGSCDRRK